MTSISVLQNGKRGQSLCMMARNMGCDLATRQRQDKVYVKSLQVANHEVIAEGS